MYITYYKNQDYKYTTRKRHKSLPAQNIEYVGVQLGEGHCRSEEQRKVLLGDGVNTSVKTSSLNICDYVTIGKNANDTTPTRWFVVFYNYLNGGQIELSLIRDVVGEFGINEQGLFGKVERGYLANSNMLINRKELSVNEILKAREHLRPVPDSGTQHSYTFGNYQVSVDNDADDDDMLWGILYFAKQKELNKFTVDIPEFSKVNLSLSYQNNLTGAIPNNNFNSTYDGVAFFFYFAVTTKSGNDVPVPYYMRGIIRFYATNSGYTYRFAYENLGVVRPNDYNFIYVNFTDSSNNTVYLPYSVLDDFCDYFINKVASNVINNTQNSNSGYLKFPDIGGYSIIEDEQSFLKYDNQYVKDNSTGNYYLSTISSSSVYIAGNTGNSNYNAVSALLVNGDTFIFDYQDVTYLYNIILTFIEAELPTVDTSSIIRLDIMQVNYTPVSLSTVNSIELSYQGDILDEPFFTMAVPLCKCSISNLYSISKANAIYAFNSIIKNLSGENGYIIDAQITSYCPNLKSVVELKKLKVDGTTDYIIPLFYLKSSSYERTCEIGFTFKDTPSGLKQINTNKKKEYSKRSFSILSPEQSGKAVFNFYDYVRPSYLNNATVTVQFIVKIALKPYSLIASCIIKRINDNGKLPIQGMTYNSDLRGCQPNSGGFQASLASNAFETYKRQNSNYQQIFNKQQEALRRQHGVERGNEITQGIFNTLSMTAMGAIAGAEMASVKILGTDVSRAAGAAVGAGVAGGITTAANVAQFAINESMRQYEYAYNQEMFDLNIGTIKNIPDSVNRISSFNEIILKDFWFTIELYECSEDENSLIDTFFEKYGYEVGVYDNFSSYLIGGVGNVFFLKGRLLKSLLNVNLHNVAQKELEGGIYYIQ